MVITFSHMKGGVGKSTLAQCFAFAVKEAGQTVTLVDTDPQQSLVELARIAQWDISVKPLFDNFDKLNEIDSSVIVVDTPPFLAAHLPEIFKYSDLILVPCKCAYKDAKAIVDTLQITRQSGVKTSIVLNMVSTNPRNSMKAKVMEILSPNPEPVIAEIKQRNAYMDIDISSGNIYSSGDVKAMNEVTELFENALNFLMSK